jgi:hypothetical protein
LFVPGPWRLAERPTGGTHSAAYCDEIWLRHLIAADSVGLPTSPHLVAELGPGDSLGAGMETLPTGLPSVTAWRSKSAGEREYIRLLEGAPRYGDNAGRPPDQATTAGAGQNDPALPLPDRRTPPETPTRVNTPIQI